MHVQDEDQPATADEETPTDPRPRRRLSVWQETVTLLGAALVLSFVVKTFLVQAFYIPSGSMEPGLVLNDRILVQKVSYWGSDTPARGDVVVFEDPGGWLDPAEAAGPASPVAQGLSKIGLYPSGGHLVKRVVGVAGDELECCDDQGRILLNGEPLGASYTKNDKKCDAPMIGCNWRVGPVPEGYVFVLGDHRDASADSTVHICRDEIDPECAPGDEFVATDLVVGKVFARVWPASRFTFLDRPKAFEGLE